MVILFKIFVFCIEMYLKFSVYIFLNATKNMKHYSLEISIQEDELMLSYNLSIFVHIVKAFNSTLLQYIQLFDLNNVHFLFQDCTSPNHRMSNDSRSISLCS